MAQNKRLVMVGEHVRVCRHAFSARLRGPRAAAVSALLQRAVLTRLQLEHQTALAGAHGVGEAPTDIIRPPPAAGLCGSACMALGEPPVTTLAKGAAAAAGLKGPRSPFLARLQRVL
jgi:hypothetical protein